MTSPYLIPCLVTLRAEFNKEAPNRDKGADGWIGDAKHQNETSDHNPDSQGRVLAIDIDSSGPWPAGYTLDTYVNDIIAKCQNGDEDRLEYIIRNGKIYERHNGYKARDYNGSDPHRNHAHFSARHDHTGQNDTGEWFMLSATDKAWLVDQFNGIADDVWAKKIQDPYAPNDPDRNLPASTWLKYSDSRGQLSSVEADIESKIDGLTKKP